MTINLPDGTATVPAAKLALLEIIASDLVALRVDNRAEFDALPTSTYLGAMVDALTDHYDPGDAPREVVARVIGAVVLSQPHDVAQRIRDESLAVLMRGLS